MGDEPTSLVDRRLKKARMNVFAEILSRWDSRAGGALREAIDEALVAKGVMLDYEAGEWDAIDRVVNAATEEGQRLLDAETKAAEDLNRARVDALQLRDAAEKRAEAAERELDAYKIVVSDEALRLGAETTATIAMLRSDADEAREALIDAARERAGILLVLDSNDDGETATRAAIRVRRQRDEAIARAEAAEMRVTEVEALNVDRNAQTRALMAEVARLVGIIADARYCIDADAAPAALRATLEGNGLEPGIAAELRSDLDRLRDEVERLTKERKRQCDLGTCEAQNLRAEVERLRLESVAWRNGLLADDAIGAVVVLVLSDGMWSADAWGPERREGTSTIFKPTLTSAAWKVTKRALTAEQLKAAWDESERMAEVERLRASYVPQHIASACISRLNATGFDVEGKPNTLWAMVRSACEEVERLRAAGDALRDTAAKHVVLVENTKGEDAAEILDDALDVWDRARGPRT